MFLPFFFDLGVVPVSVGPHCKAANYKDDKYNYYSYEDLFAMSS